MTKTGVILLSSLAFLITGCHAGNKIFKAYAYSQPVFPGAKIVTETDESGNLKYPETRQKNNYYIYAVTDPDKEIEITDLWIEGIHFTAKTEIIGKTPVEKNYPDEFEKIKPDTLVPYTTRKVRLLLPGDNTTKTGNPAPALPSKYKQYNLVIGFRVNQKLKFCAIKHFTSLNPMVTQ